MKRIFLLFAFWCVFSGHAQIIDAPVLYATEDAQTSSGSPSAYYGTSISTMDVSKTSSSIFRSFVKFNLSSLTSNMVITSAILQLTPSGTEGLGTGSSNLLYLDVCNTSWTESSINHSSNISNNTLFQTVNTSNWNASTNKREFQIKEFVQAIADGRLPNQGWRIRRSDETTNATTTYYTRESTTTSNQPQLLIKYYIRPSISAATIVHTSSLTSTNGSISPTIINGSNTTMTCKWFNSSGTQIATGPSLSNVGKGWYGLKYYGLAPGDTSYQAFIIGTECETTTFTFDPGPDYIDDANLIDLISGSGTTVVDRNNVNYGSSVLLSAERWTNSGNWYNEKTLIKFKLWVDPNCQVNSANMTLTGNNHYPLNRPNDSEFDLNTTAWTEYGVANFNPPTFTTTGRILIPGIATGNTNLTKDIASFFNLWKTNNANNFGFIFKLQSYANNQYTRMQFNSSDASASLRPKIEFSIKVNSCDLSRKGSLTITENDPALKKNVQLSITPPSWAVSPYRYVISDRVIPNPQSVLRYLNDSVYDPDLDSINFYRGFTNATNFNFGNVDYGTYSIAVFDNAGNRIYDNSSLDLYPVLSLRTATNAVVADNNLIRPNTPANGLCEINAFTNTYTQGTVKINPNVLTGTQYYGFVDVSTTLGSGSNIRYGYYLNGSRLYTIKNFIVSSSYVNIGADNYVNMSLVNDTIIFTNDTTVIDKAALSAGYSFKLGGVMNSASRTRIKLSKISLKPFHLITLSSNERTCSSLLSNYQFKMSPFLGTFGNYNYSLVNRSDLSTFASGSGSNSNTYTISNVPPGAYELRIIQSTGTTPISLTYNIYIGVQAEWFSTHPNYDLLPNTYSLKRNSSSPISVYSSALSSNVLAAGSSGWIWFTPVVTAFSNNRNDFFTISDNFGTTQPSSTQTYLNFRKVLPTISGGIVTNPGGIQLIWNDPINQLIHSTYINPNSFISIEMNGSYMYVRANEILIATIAQPSGPIRLKANSNRTAEGFLNVHSTFGCTTPQTINQVGYYELGRDYTAGYATAVEGKLKFTFDEEYSIESGKYLQYVVFNDANTPIASGNLNSNATSGGASALAYSFDDNRYILSVSNISLATPGKFYHLEVTTSTGQKRVLRFLYKN